jgi:hypothetical protein
MEPDGVRPQLPEKVSAALHKDASTTQRGPLLRLEPKDRSCLAIGHGG